ncbi:hypothetical protein [Rhizobium leguminosarum]|uniref:hypothetical protein n=1 Tax=Rhizobium leguminosarum TaxID=384 RepID=UPI001F3F5B43|nr:hypothetical protein [Rhizobium leguminosarum]UIJ82216.1 hypothetical protein LZK78_25250 [Rhizobium leguminosarum]
MTEEATDAAMSLNNEAAALKAMDRRLALDGAANARLIIDRPIANECLTRQFCAVMSEGPDLISAL